MSWEMYEAAKKIADGWYSELEATRTRNAVLGRDNAKLREEIEAAKYDLSIFSKRIVELDSENAKLRELARHMRTCMEHYEMDGTISCDRCPLDNDTGNCDFERRMRELGVDTGDAID